MKILIHTPPIMHVHTRTPSVTHTPHTPHTEHQLQEKFSNMDRLHVTALMASMGYLWIGTSIGAILIYQIPHLEGIPLISGKNDFLMCMHCMINSGKGRPIGCAYMY